MKAKLYSIKVWVDQYIFALMFLFSAIMTVWGFKAGQPTAIAIFAALAVLSLLLQIIFDVIRGVRVSDTLDPYDRQAMIQSNRRKFKLVKGGKDG